MDVVVFSIVGVVAIVLLVWSILRSWARNDEIEQFLSMNGFAPCEEEANDLLEKVHALERNSEYRYKVSDLYKASAKGCTIYFYQKTRKSRPGNPYAVDEFLIPCSRRSSEPFVLYLKPAVLNQKLATRLLKGLTSINWDAQPDDLVPLHLPSESVNENLLNVLGPDGRSLAGLVDPDRLNTLSRGGDFGVLVMRFGGDLCSLEYLRNYPGADLKKLWTYLQELLDDARRAEADRSAECLVNN